MSELVKKITFREIRDAARNGHNAVVIINGETYIVDPSENDFVNGVRFAADVIEDNRSRRNTSFLWTDGRKKNLTKKAVQINDARNQEAKTLFDFLRYIATDNESITPWINAASNFWRLET